MSRYLEDFGGQAVGEPTAQDTLTRDRAELLRDVQRRSAPVLALIAAHAWPEAELRVLTGYVRAEVLKQAAREDPLLGAHGAAAPYAELSADHLALHTLTDQLDHVDATSCPLPELSRLVEQLVSVLEHHLGAEQALLAALPSTLDESDLTELLGTRVVDDETVILLLDALPVDRAAKICIDALLRLRTVRTVR